MRGHLRLKPIVTGDQADYETKMPSKHVECGWIQTLDVIRLSVIVTEINLHNIHKYRHEKWSILSSLKHTTGKMPPSYDVPIWEGLTKLQC